MLVAQARAEKLTLITDDPSDTTSKPFGSSPLPPPLGLPLGATTPGEKEQANGPHQLRGG